MTDPNFARVFILNREQRLQFWSRVDDSAGPDACWPWTADRNGHDYGLYSWWDVQDKRKRTSTAQRVAFALTHRMPLPFEMEVDHICGVHACVNPRHLRLLSAYDNNMAGNGMGARNKRATHCVRNHEFTPENTRLRRYKDTGRQHRTCLTCEADRAAKRIRPSRAKKANHHNTNKVECVHGHDLTDRDNVRINVRADGRTSRACLACQRDRARRTREQRKAS